MIFFFLLIDSNFAHFFSSFLVFCASITMFPFIFFDVLAFLLFLISHLSVCKTLFDSILFHFSEALHWIYCFSEALLWWFLLLFFLRRFHYFNFPLFICIDRIFNISSTLQKCLTMFCTLTICCSSTFLIYIYYIIFNPNYILFCSYLLFDWSPCFYFYIFDFFILANMIDKLLFLIFSTIPFHVFSKLIFKLEIIMFIFSWFLLIVSFICYMFTTLIYAFFINLLL
jgi:hypothetical protein